MNQNKQFIGDQPILNHEMIDEYYIPQRTVKHTLQSIVEEEMRAANLDPSNSEDVTKYWLGKGIGNA